MKAIFKLCLTALFLAGCARIPVQSVALADALKTEGERMHKLNLVFLNRIFIAKREEVDKFIKNEYAPKAISLFVARVEKTMPATDFKKDFHELMQAITPEINARRDSMVNALEMQKEKIVEKLDTDYRVFDNAAFELKKLLESSVRVDREKQALFDRAKALSNNRIDFNNIETALNRFIHASGSVGNNIHELNSFINQLLNTK